MENLICVFSVEGWYNNINLPFFAKKEDFTYWLASQKLTGIDYQEIKKEEFEKFATGSNILNLPAISRQIYIPLGRVFRLEEVDSNIDLPSEVLAGVSAIFGGLTKLDKLDTTPPSERGVTKTMHNFWLKVWLNGEKFPASSNSVRFPISNDQKIHLEEKGYLLNQKVIL